MLEGHRKTLEGIQDAVRDIGHTIANKAPAPNVARTVENIPIPPPNKFTGKDQDINVRL